MVNTVHSYLLKSVHSILTVTVACDGGAGAEKATEKLELAVTQILRRQN